MKSTIETTLLQNSTLPQVISTTSSDWQQCLNDIPHDFYHLPGYLELEARKSNTTPEAVVIREGEQLFFLPYLIRDCYQLLNTSTSGYDKIYDVISPYGYPGILVNKAGQNSEFIKKCLNLTYDCWQQKNICAAFLRLHPILNDYIDTSISDLDKFTVCHQGDVVICDLTVDTDEIWKQMRKNHRTRINKLRNSGFTVKMVSIEKYLDTFIDIYRETMNRVHANQSYYYTREYFRNLVGTLADRVNLCAVETNGQIVSICMITELHGTVQYYLGGTMTEYLPQAPTTMMLDYIIKWSKARNNKYLNLGGGLGGNKDSLYHYKAGFSDLSKPFMTIKSIVNHDLYDHLTCLKSAASGMTIAEIQNTDFFPAYSLN
jgi:hypothetical protein